MNYVLNYIYHLLFTKVSVKAFYDKQIRIQMNSFLDIMKLYFGIGNGRCIEEVTKGSGKIKGIVSK